jgi:hypothetical protein
LSLFELLWAGVGVGAVNILQNRQQQMSHGVRLINNSRPVQAQTQQCGLPVCICITARDHVDAAERKTQAACTVEASGNRHRYHWW